MSRDGSILLKMVTFWKRLPRNLPLGANLYLNRRNNIFRIPSHFFNLTSKHFLFVFCFIFCPSCLEVTSLVWTIFQIFRSTVWTLCSMYLDIPLCHVQMYRQPVPVNTDIFRDMFLSFYFFIISHRTGNFHLPLEDSPCVNIFLLIHVSLLTLYFS